jgi:hypothetical protein
MIVRTKIGLRKTLKRISKSQLKTVQVCINGSSINHSLLKDVHNFYVKGSKLKCSGYRIQTKVMEII